MADLESSFRIHRLRKCLCGSDAFDLVFEYREAPVGEIRFPFSASGSYRREVVRCRTCGHFMSFHEMDTTGLYGGDYVNSTYGNDSGLRKNFERIVNLAPEKSDNTGRVTKVCEFGKVYLSGGIANAKILDVGSGLCVFLFRMKQEGWNCTALDPDPRSCRHAREIAGVSAICGDFMAVNELGHFDAISFNKVLEHVEDPIAMLRKARDYLAPGGFVYVELPDGEAAAQAGQSREEFFIDHLHIFSAVSFSLMVERAGFALLNLERLREPSTKFTLRGFAIHKL